MIAILSGVFVASLLGSVHCVGMCGPFSLVCAGHGRGAGAVKAHAAYHLGRAVTYAALGGIAGSIGSALDLAGEGVGIARAAAWVSGALLILWGVGLLWPGVRSSGRLGKRLGQGLVQLRTKPPVVRSSLIGLATPLLPCGWLYAFAVSAAGTGSPALGAFTMVAFWLGTVPALLGAGALLSRMSAGLRRRAPVFAGVVLIVVGLVNVTRRASVPHAFAAPPSTALDAAPGEKGALEPGSLPARPSCH